MRKIVMMNRVSVDGFYAGPNGEIDWFIHDPEVDKAAHQMMHPDSVLFGRVTYQMFASQWPQVAQNPNASQGERVIANELDRMTKIVFSKTLKDVNWVNSRLVQGDLIEEVQKLKQGQGADFTIFGSGTLVQQLGAAGLIDEYLVILTPVVLGKGKPFFKDVNQRNLRLLETREFKSGNVVLHYAI